ncbi:hypothetical protein CN495_08470 [Bacillus thuringiensis]|uniref:HNH endonuclease n=1 Tax=Bacillus thuringiensis TaxID=1428 RepID=A0ABD6SNH6_BACTU|nr:hypothetical protein [Bacillus thuringiensis]PER55777.1 hypothetical protein CN495_08470 [Bacillus thuringiensis]
MSLKKWKNGYREKERVSAVRNKYAGTCYRCGGHVGVGEGHFERYKGGWRTQHASCAIQHRELKRKREQEKVKHREA